MKFIRARFLSLLLMVLLPLGACNDDQAVNSKTEFEYAPVSSATLTANRTNFSGQCPHKFKVEAVISTTGPGWVFLEFLDGDAFTIQRRSLEFDSAGTKSATLDLNAERSGEFYVGLKVTESNFSVPYVAITVNCVS